MNALLNETDVVGPVDRISELGAKKEEPPKKLVHADDESALKDRVRFALEASRVIREICDVRADKPQKDALIEAIIDSTVVEVIRILGMEPRFVNLREVKSYPPYP